MGHPDQALPNDPPASTTKVFPKTYNKNSPLAQLQPAKADLIANPYSPIRIRRYRRARMAACMVTPMSAGDSATSMFAL